MDRYTAMAKQYESNWIDIDSNNWLCVKFAGQLDDGYMWAVVEEVIGDGNRFYYLIDYIEPDYDIRNTGQNIVEHYGITMDCGAYSFCAFMVDVYEDYTTELLDELFSQYWNNPVARAEFELDYIIEDACGQWGANEDVLRNALDEGYSFTQAGNFAYDAAN